MNASRRLIDGFLPDFEFSERHSIETRIAATDDSARCKFSRYWSFIHPGSALIRRMWLRAIKRRAETPPSS